MIIGVASADYVRGDRNPTGEDQWGGAGWARLGQYLPFFRAEGHQVVCGTMWLDQGVLTVEDAALTRVKPDVLIMQRLMIDGVADAIRVGQAAGQIIINDLDDWYWGLDPSNEAFMGVHPKNVAGENIHHFGPALAASDFMTVSTPYLAERLQRRVRCPIEVIPNYIDVSRFTPVVQSPGVPLFGWAGSTSHRSGDLETVAGVLRPRIVDGTIRMHHSGDLLASPPMFAALGVEDHLISRTPRVNAADYPSLLTFDVGIIPLRDTPFNHAKSDIKGLEYAAAGIPFIAQDLPSYAKLHKDWEGAFHLAHRPKDWIAGIKRYTSYENRLEDQALILDWVKRRDIQYGAARWLDLLERL